ncbi:MarR family winged helix-turn-helix transcriptional regulator [Streptococcus equinus]|uniref:MarR family winged helix-turn-helix transcriptional regulator n=1 Tax=Streptococcus equinus TaxID=1335 RepID=UPI000402D0FC|nr:MarR family transcriptional regulator [Streptococcus equinus]QMS95942.1 transcriptional regulator [Streptococcus equinus]SEK23118.1 DNA-binding transcriptional regulator, MarR family [Streptococcus equinus]SFQ60344.1 DNA-binding transcriptional regulator, MarR family [Streptococcus equinus]
MPKDIQKLLENDFFFSLKKLNRILDKKTEETYRKIGLSHTYALTLFILSQEDGKCYKDLADILCITAPSMTKIIEKLNRRDLVNIIPNGRTKQIYLSDKGKDLADVIAETFFSTRQEFIKLAEINNLNDISTLNTQINQITKMIN